MKELYRILSDLIDALDGGGIEISANQASLEGVASSEIKTKLRKLERAMEVLRNNADDLRSDIFQAHGGRDLLL